ncbi:glycosyltransferase [Halomonas sp. DP8Y7-1]|uniref:glycosyltransferase family 2 protein n=1 Tax=Halomonas sp. DP8Y7-1 TaxID=2859078 RepID=UPI001C97FA44|nr:glycosyltransferase family 2 protein [Halomonas sp. DP8Y7-1]MBY6030305.1 glycosyltransferase [Halomonas sp. DP8Y7-1]
MKLVSIITPLYNCEHRLRKTVQSVIDQSYDNWELIIVDDCSTDNSLNVALELGRSDSRIVVYGLDENCGPAVARNYALSKASGNYIAFLDSDDVWYADKLSRQVNFIERTGCAFTYTSYLRVSDNNKNLGKVVAPESLTYNDLLKGCSIGCLTVMYDYQKVGLRKMPSILKRQDLGLWLDILRDIPEGLGISEVLAEYTVRRDSVSGNKLQAARYQWKLYREVEKLGFLVSCYYFFHYATSALVKRARPNR